MGQAHGRGLCAHSAATHREAPRQGALTAVAVREADEPALRPRWLPLIRERRLPRRARARALPLARGLAPV